MNCPVCDHHENDVLEVRGDRRRRACRRCPHRWTTYEITKEKLERLERLERAVSDAMEPSG